MSDATPARAKKGRATPRGTVVAYRYSIEARLGKGGIGAVYLASDLHAGGRAVALKILRDDRIGEEREKGLATEYATLARLRHPHIEAVWDFGRDPEHGVYIAKEYLSGSDLMKATESMSFEDCLLLSVQLFRALAFLHSRRLIHNDLKPDNVLVTRDPSFDLDRRCVLIDFGIASEYSHENTEQTPTGLVGTLGYLAPERVKGTKPNARTDLYAAGIVLYKLLTRTFPFNPKSEAAELLGFHLYQKPPPPSSKRVGVPPEMDSLVLKLLEKDPEARFASAHEVLRTIGEILGEESTLETEATQESYVRSVPLVGRDEPLAALTALVEHGVAGSRRQSEPALLVIEGGPGMGKSRLLSEILVRARLSGVQVLTGSGRRHGGGLGPLRAPLRRLMSNEEAQKSLEFLEEPDDEEKADRLEVLRTLGDLIVERAREVVLAVEDLHNTDDLTLDLLSYVGRLLKRQSGARLVIMLTTRGRTGPGLERFFRRSEKENLAHVFSLEPLTEDQAMTFVTEALGRRPDPTFVSALHEKTGGDPEAVQEALKLLMAVHVLTEETWSTKGGWDLCVDALPEGVIPILTARLALLDASSRRLMKLLSILNRSVPAGFLAAVTEIPPQQAGFLLSDLSKRELVLSRVQGGEFHYVVGSDRMAQAVLESAESEEIRDLHDRVTVQLELQSGERGEEELHDLAYHAVRSGNPVRAATHALEAGRRLEAIYAWDQATELYETLADVEGLEAATRVRVQLRLGGIHEQLGDYRKALRYLALADRQAGRLGLKAERAKALHHGAAIVGRKGNRWRAEVRAIKALMLYGELEDQNGVAHVKLLMAQFLYDEKDWRRASKLATEARRLFESVGDITGLGQTLNLRGLILWKQRKMDEAAHYFRQAYRIAGLVGALANWGSAILDLGDYEKANKIFRDALGLAKKEGRLRDRAVVELALGVLRYEQGSLKKAHRLFLSAFEAFEGLGERTTSTMALASLARLARERRAYDEAGRLVSQAFELLKGQSMNPSLGPALRQMAILAFLRGDLETARRAAVRSARIDSRWGETKALGMDALVLAEVAMERGIREDFLREIFDARSAFGAVHSGPGLLWTDLLLARGESLWGSAEEAVKQLDECQKTARARGMAYHEALSRLESAETIHRADPARALGDLLEPVLDYAEREAAREIDARARMLQISAWTLAGDLDRAQGALGRVLGVADPLNLYLTHQVLCLKSELLLARSRPEEALVQAASVAQKVRPLGLARLIIEADSLVGRAADAAGRTATAEAARDRVREALSTTGFRRYTEAAPE